MKTILDVDVTADLDPKGIRKLVWIGDTDVEQINEVETWEEMVYRAVNYYTFHGKIKECHRDEVEALREGLKQALAQFDTLVEECGYE